MTEEEISRIIEMAWEDRTPFEAIEKQFNMPEKQVKALMRQQLKQNSYKIWRERVTGRKTKHKSLRSPEVTRAYSSTQYKHK
ncbi:MAG TPA: TIGR03643 family protein [Ferrovaceae bacterium]|nr:TIGR03643 family protein [Ferrovaceae bacterium]